MAKRAVSKSDKRTIPVFIASPGDLAVERATFKEVIDELNDGFGDGAGVTFELLAWEATPAVMTRRSQGLINQKIDQCEVFVLAMHRRWGQEAPDAKPYSSYTEEEFHRAVDRWQRTGSPTVLVFFKEIESGYMVDPGEQLQKVLAFRRQLEAQRTLLYRPFATAAEFKEEVRNHLRAYVRGELPAADAALEKVVLPQHAIEEVAQARAKAAEAEAKAEREHQAAEAAAARAERFALEFAERASKAVREGRVEEARQDFAKATDGTANLQVLYLAFLFYWRTGDLVTAEELTERRLAISGRDTATPAITRALGNLGLIYQTRGELDRAEEMHRKALAIDEKLDNQEGIARHCGNLGIIYRTRGELERAEEMHRTSLETAEKIDFQECVSNQYGNLGLIYQTRGELDRAEELHRKSLETAEKLGRPEGMAIQYGNLGSIYEKRGELDRGEEMYRKAFDINEKLGHQPGMAIQFANLGKIYQKRGDLDWAEVMLQKALAIQERLGLQEGMAGQYANLGLIAKDRGEMDQARVLWTKARDLYAKIGMPHEVKEVQRSLDGLPKPAAKSKRAIGGGGAGRGKGGIRERPK